MTALPLNLPDPHWLSLLRDQRKNGRPISDIARDVGMPRSSVSMLLSGTYPARSLDLVAAKYGPVIVERYSQQVACPHLRRGISRDACVDHASAPMSQSNPDRLSHWLACNRCPLNPTRKEASE